MAEQVAEGPELLRLHEALECRLVALLDDLHELRHQLLVRGDAHDRLGKDARIYLRRLGRRWTAQLEAEKDALLDSDPLADETAERNRPEAVEDSPESSPVLGTKSLVGRQERLLVLGELARRSRFFKQVAEHVELEALVCHDASPARQRRSSIRPATFAAEPLRHRYRGVTTARLAAP